MLFERFETAHELFTYKLGSALKMERTVLEMLDRLHDEARSDELRRQLNHHAGETRHQLENLERAFDALGEEADDKPCPVIEAIEKEGRANIKRADDALVDTVIVAGASETEHHEIAVYEWLITEAEAMRHDTVASLLRENLEQEQHTLEEVNALAPSLAMQAASSGP